MKDMVERRRHRAGEQVPPYRQPTLAEQREEFIRNVERQNATGANGRKIAESQAREQRPDLFE